jgi:AcrR family transcriptional regulator
VANATASIRPPRQARSRASFERVLRAGRDVIEEQGYGGFTLAEVSKRAGVSIGSIYARVPSKDALFHAIHASVVDEIDARHGAFGDIERWERLSTEELIVDAVREVARPLRANTAFLRVVMQRGAIDGVVAARGSRALTIQAGQFKALVLTRRNEIAHRDPELATDIAYRMAYSTLARQVMYGPTFESQRPIKWDRLVRELGAACAAYLLVPR